MHVTTLTILLLTACGGPSSGRAAADQAGDRWFRAAWGQPPNEEQAAANAARLDCVERELSTRGADVDAEMHCLARRFAAGAECQEAGKHAQVCLDAYAAGCEGSPALSEALVACPVEGR